MRRNATIVVVALAAVVTAAVAHGGPPVSLVGRAPTLGTGETWRAIVRAPRAPTVVAQMGSRVARFRTTRVGERRYRALVRLSAPGRWTLTARLGAKDYALGAVRVVLRTYRLSIPSQLVANPDGSLLVAERGVRAQVTRIDVTTGRVSTFTTLPLDPYGLAWDGTRLLVTTHNGIYAVPAHGGRPRLVNTADVGPLVPAGATAFYANETEVGRLELTSGRRQPLPTAVKNPHTLLLGDDGRLVVADTGNERVLAVDPATGAATTIASGLTTPIPMSFGAAGELIVGEHETGRLVRISPDGSKSVFAAGLQKPYSIVKALDGNYYVAEVGDLNAATGALKRITPQGTVSSVRLRR